ncbi:hypothetical protein HQQ80_11185 [Microbacteriaceae bacterium VKM Ac-2855]|nr:hypothetical protein [Microbacteriaceae bacterium VKM Ac-2855]
MTWFDGVPLPSAQYVCDERSVQFIARGSFSAEAAPSGDIAGPPSTEDAAAADRIDAAWHAMGFAVRSSSADGAAGAAAASVASYERPPGSVVEGLVLSRSGAGVSVMAASACVANAP